MSERPEREKTRREFFVNALRGLAAGALAAGGAFLLSRRRAAGEFECISDGACGACPLLGRCPLNDGRARRAE